MLLACLYTADSNIGLNYNISECILIDLDLITWLEPTGVCEGLDVVGQVNVHTFCILHFLEDDANEPHGDKVVPVPQMQHKLIEH